MPDTGVYASSPSSSGPHRLVSVQILRGVAAMLVVWLHLNVAHSDVHSEAGRSAIGQFAQTYQFGGIGVDVFFLISGFVITFSMEQYAGRPLAFIRQRFLRVAPMAYLAAAAWIGLLVAGGRPVALDGILSCITFLPLLPHYAEPTLQLLWTLSFEFTFYLLVMGALSLRLGPRQLLWIVAGLGIVGLFVVMPIPLLRWFTHPLLLEFALGITAFLFWRVTAPARPVALCVGALGVALLGAEALLGIPLDTNPALTIAGPMAGPRLLLWAIPSLFVLIALLEWRPRDGRAVRAAQRVGDASYSIYLTQLIPIRAAAYFVPLAADARWLIGFAGAIATGLAVHRYVERPMLKRMVKKGATHKPGPQTAGGGEDWRASPVQPNFLNSVSRP